MNQELEILCDEAVRKWDNANRLEAERVNPRWRAVAETLLDTAKVFFRNNPNKDVFSTTRPSSSQEFKQTLERMAKCRRYCYDVNFPLFLPWKVKIHRNEHGFSFTHDDCYY